MLIDYNAYLDGDDWPSESTTMAGTGSQIETKWVGDMPPQYAASALAKLVRWARDSAVTAQEIDQEEHRVRASRLGQLLAARALSIDDFTLTEYVMSHGAAQPSTTYLDKRELAVALVYSLLPMQSLEMDPEQIGSLAVHVAGHVYEQGYGLVKVEQ